MAQPLFDDHPLQDYFRESGDSEEPLSDGHRTPADEVTTWRRWQQVNVLLAFLFERLQFLARQMPSLTSSHASNPFAERFTHAVISSSLLSATLVATSQPGQKRLSSGSSTESDSTLSDHSRTSSTTVENNSIIPPSKQQETPQFGDTRIVVGIISMAVLALATGYELLAMLLVAVALYVSRAVRHSQEQEEANNIALTLNALDDLISAGNVWDSVMHAGISIIEENERNLSSSLHMSTLRDALETSLVSTQNGCDTVRCESLAGIASLPTELAKLYAPTSPSESSSIPSDHPRPRSDPVARWRTGTMSTPFSNKKRATWNGSSLAALSPTSSIKSFSLSDRRRSDMSTLYKHMKSPTSSASAPPTPLSAWTLPEVEEEADGSESESELPYLKDKNTFAVKALALRKERLRTGLEVLGAPPPRYSIRPSHHVSHSSITSLPSPSRFSLLQSNRHASSLSPLQTALHGALSAKRYTCAHFLALDFGASKSDAYWGGVRTTMAGLTAIFKDTSHAVNAALNEVAKQHAQNDKSNTGLTAESSGSQVLAAEHLLHFGQAWKPKNDVMSFAPSPSHLMQFAVHVGALTTALANSQTHLQDCVDALRNTSPASDLDPFTAGPEPMDRALQSYDELRKQLGLAFRECERGRQRLQDVIAATKEAPPPVEEEDENDATVTPALAHDYGSDESFGPDATSPTLLHTPDNVDDETHQALDDATEHLLLSATTEHLPPPGVEQVYEAESDARSNFNRERSKLSREERIKLAKAKRESGVGLGISVPDSLNGYPAQRKWNLDAEVIKELKEVVSVVGKDKRPPSREPTSNTSHSQPPTDPFLDPPSPTDASFASATSELSA